MIYTNLWLTERVNKNGKSSSLIFIKYAIVQYFMCADFKESFVTIGHDQGWKWADTNYLVPKCCSSFP